MEEFENDRLKTPMPVLVKFGNGNTFPEMGTVNLVVSREWEIG